MILKCIGNPGFRASLLARGFWFCAATAAWAGGPGAETTARAPAAAYGRQAFAQPAANLDRASHRAFAEGSRLFHNDWVETDPTGRQPAGLGPHFAARACAGCHVHDGRGAPGAAGLAVRLALPPGTPQDVVAAYGEQLTPLALAGVAPRGQLRIRWQAVPGRFADGQRYTLRRPVLEPHAPGYGPLPNGTGLSARVAPQLVGLGLLDAVVEDDIWANERAQAAQPGPVKGRAGKVFEPFDGREVVGRFGWKASAGSLHHQIASALFHDMGVTSPQFPGQPVQRGQGGHGVQPVVPQPELSRDTFLLMLDYQFGLGVPARRRTETAQVRRGEALFTQAQCATCHRPAYTTGKGWFPALSRQAIRPYTDLLLHDMGAGLADSHSSGQAGGAEWRTPPLWGVGLIPQVNGHQLLLHDGRARGVLEAILWHGGEADPSRRQVLRMSPGERRALVAFVNSL